MEKLLLHGNVFPRVRDMAPRHATHGKMFFDIPGKVKRYVHFSLSCPDLDPDLDTDPPVF